MTAPAPMPAADPAVTRRDRERLECEVLTDILLRVVKKEDVGRRVAAILECINLMGTLSP